jgi:hypothetical protein
MKLFQFLILAAVSLLVACSPSKQPSEIEVEPGAYPPPTNQEAVLPEKEIGTENDAPSNAYPPPDLADPADETGSGGRVAEFPDTIIVYQREGRLPDSPQKWTFYPTGRIVAGDNSEWQVPAQEVQPLFESVEAPDFWSLHEKYAPAGECLDCLVHTLTVFYQGKVKEITVIQGGADLLDNLGKILDGLNTLVSPE